MPAPVCRPRLRPLACAFALVSSGLLSAQTASNDSEARPDDPIQLSPFEVVTDNRGYLASNALSGTRLNTSLENIASSITVVTKLQLEDIAATDINDVFLYEASTEGTGNYTSVTPNRDGGVNDNIAQNPSTANRIRGLGSANIAIGNFASNPLIPIDLYNIEAIEISRGPNSNIFGLGSPSGTVNLVPAYANLTRDITSATVRVDDRGGFRSSLDVSRPLVDQKLAVRVAGVYEDKAFERKPSKEEIRRYQLSLQFKPFRGTTIKASAEAYRNEAQRANSITPRETITDWEAAGSPTWNPATRIVTFANGSTSGPFNVSQDNSLPMGLIGDSGYYNRTPVSLEPDGSVSYWSIARTGNAATPRTRNRDIRLLRSASDLSRSRVEFPLFLEPGTRDQSIYDWTSVNFMAPNLIEDEAETYVVELEQFLVDNESHLLAARAGYFRQDFERYERVGNLIGPNDAKIYVDVNEKNIDGTPNANFRRPFINSAGGGVMFRTPETEETISADLVYRYTPDRDIKWIGAQTINLHGERRERSNVNYRYRDYIVSDHSWTSSSNRMNSTETMYQYYLGSAGSGRVESAPTDVSLPAGTYPFTWFNGATQTWVTDQATLAEAPINNTRTRTRDIDSANVTYQGQFWQDKLIATVGFRNDQQEENTSDAWEINSNTGFYDETSGSLKVFPNDPVEQEGDTVTLGAVYKVTPWLRLFYNWADSFTPEPTRYDIDGILMENPTAEGQDFGFAVTLLDGKLVVKLNRYEVDEINARIEQLGTIGSRTHVLEGGRDENATSFLTWARNVIRTRYAAQGITATEEQIYDVAATELVKLDPGFLRQTDLTGAVGVGGDRRATGYEVEAIYNPTRNWRIKFNVAQQETVDSNIGGELTAYIDRRLPVWTTAVDDQGNRWWDANNSAARASFESGIQAPYLFEIANDGKPRAQVREWRWNALTNYDFTEGTFKNWSVGGAVRWEDKAAIGFLGRAPEADGVIRELDPDRPVYDQARFHFDLSLGYRFKLANDRIRVRTQLNVRDMFEDGRLQTVAVDPLGNPTISRIIDPRQIILTTTFEF